MDTINRARLRVWAQQPPEFFEEAILDADGTIVPSDAECKQGMDFAYDGQYGYHPLLISLANTAEPLFLFNRSGNRPSQERADVFLDKAVTLCRQAGFRKILLRGDTKFAQTKHLDRWDAAGDIRFIFGYEAHDSLKARADDLPADAYRLLKRPPQYQIKTTPREKPERVKPEIVRERGYETIHLLEEMVAEFDYRPIACKKSYRMIVLRKRVEVDKGQMRLFEEYRYFFYITNDRTMTAEEVVFSANDRCDQENLIAQLKSGVQALTAPVDDLVSNWAYMVMGVVGVEPQGLERPAGAGVASAPGQTRGGETDAVEDGVRDVLRGFHPDAVPDRAERTTVDLPVAVVEPVARGLPPAGRAAARVLAVLKDRATEVGVRMPRSVWAIEQRKGRDA